MADHDEQNRQRNEAMRKRRVREPNRQVEETVVHRADAGAPVSPLGSVVVKSAVNGAFIGAALVISIYSGLWFLGFHSSGISAGSIASFLMSLSTTLGFLKGVVSFLQSCGASGAWMYFKIFCLSMLILVVFDVIRYIHNGDRVQDEQSNESVRDSETPDLLDDDLLDNDLLDDDLLDNDQLDDGQLDDDF